MSLHEEEKIFKEVVYYFKCEKCKSDIFWSEVKPSVQRAARVFKWVRAGCPAPDCEHSLTLSNPDKIYEREEAKRLYDEMKAKGSRVYWV
ncbi:MAG TPA: hypothetical protein PLP82_09220 [Deltaproteobacteria bacterium]|jgi:hypothetical protein|nr:hypothetical protein [Deltaproteobacteria bacterium]OQC29424.1 MAG: hypothetical protein BWX71_00129 [Deltaproteobacteria bacterium ADurb.Bin072]HRW80430.1 hypothetical protein [Desulfomonilia bacterium]NMD39649.1 hypothetical protein [Deltaproteobacteria bacterium]HNQ84320.1 hypothetical protein [Deltaproteobacteria bacterium]